MRGGGRRRGSQSHRYAPPGNQGPGAVWGVTEAVQSAGDHRHNLHDWKGGGRSVLTP